MTAVDPAALRELLAASSVTPLAVKTTTDDGWAYLMDTPETYVGVGDADGDAMFRVEDAQLIAGTVNALPDLLAELEQTGAERDAANAQAAKLAGEQSVDRDQIARLLDLCVEADGDLTERTAERDRAREAAAALEAECAELRAALVRVRDKAEASTDEREVEYAASREAAAAGQPFRTVCTRCDSVEIAAAVLARTDPLRAEAEGGEDRD